MVDGNMARNEYLNQEQKQISFAWKSGLILFGSIALFIGIGIYLFGGFI